MTQSLFFYRNPDAPVPNRPLSLGVVALIEWEGKLLLDRRADAGRWAIVGGIVEMDDSLENALRREVREETNLTISSFALLGTFSDPSRRIQYPDGTVLRVVTLAYRVAIDDIRALTLSHESQEMRLFAREELVALDVVETHRHIIAAFLESHAVVLA